MNKGENFANIQIKKKQIASLKIEEHMLQDKIAEVREKIKKEEDCLKKLNKNLLI